MSETGTKFMFTQSNYVTTSLSKNIIIYNTVFCLLNAFVCSLVIAGVFIRLIE